MDASTRRHFLKSSAAAGLAVPGMAAQSTKVAAKDKIRIATIGIGGMGTGATRSSPAVPGVELVAVSDVYEGRLTRQRGVWLAPVYHP